MNVLERINASEVAAHRHAAKAQQIGPFMAVSTGRQTPLDTAWFDGLRLPTATEVRQLEEFCLNNNQTVTIHALSHVGAALIPLLKAQGYAVSYILHVYAHHLTNLPERPSMTIKSETDAEEWAQLSAKGFGEGTLEIMRLVAQQPYVQCFTAEQNDENVATAAMQVTGDVAALYGTSTHPEFRGQGAQMALLKHRLYLASEQGATLASVFVTPGTPSERNIRRAGFQLAGVRLTFNHM